MGLLIAPRLSVNVLEFTPVDESVASLCLWVGWVLTVDTAVVAKSLLLVVAVIPGPAGGHQR